jgi:tetratricopeptide (TPR) repeat protein
MKHGRTGQPQHGVDIYGRPDRGETWAGVQCKGKDNIYAPKKVTKKELQTEVKKAKGFTPKLTEWIIASTGPKDVAVEELARQITAKHLEQGLFSVHVWGWQDILERLEEFPEIIRKNYLHLFISEDTTSSSSKLDEIRETTQEILEDSAEVKKSLSAITERLTTISPVKSEGPAGAGSAEVPADVLTEYQAELDHARDLLNSYKYTDCLVYLEKLKSRIWSSAPPIIKFRLLTNIGAAKLKLDQREAAARLFLEARQYNPDDEKALTNVALAHLVLGQFEDAATSVRRVLEKNPASGNAYTIYVQIPLPDETLETAISKVPEAFRTLPEVAYALGLIAQKNNKFAETRSWLETAVRNDKDNVPDFRGTLGTFILDSMTRRQSVVTYEQLNDAQCGEVLEAKRLLTEAWDRVAETDLRNDRLPWLVNRSLANKLLSDLDEAVKDVETALAGDPSNPIYIKHRAVLAYLNEEGERALDILRGILNAKETPEAVLIYGDILLTEKRAGEAAAVLEGMLSDPDVPNYLKDDARRSLIGAYVRLKEFNKAKAISDAMRSDNPTEILNLADAAEIARLTGNSDEALALLQEAKKYIDENTSYKRLMDLADEFYSLGQFGEAADIYDKIANKDLDSPVTRRLLNSYYRFGKLSPALEICRNLREKHGPLPFITHIESAIYEEIDNFEQAREVCEIYLRAFPGDPEMRVRLAVVNWRSSNYGELDAYLDSSPDIDALSMKHGLQLAHLYSVRDRVNECFDTIYELRRKYYDRPEPHLEYVRLFFEKAKGSYEWLAPQSVKANVAVCVEDAAGEKQWYLIEDRKDADFRRGEVKPEHEFARRLLGKSIGDEVVLKVGLHSPEMGKVVDFKSKYVYALHETFAIYEKMFPGVGGLWMFYVGDPAQPDRAKKALDEILESVSRRKESGDELDRYYKEGKLTIGSMAGLLNVDVVTVWNTIRSNPDVGVRCSSGSVAERDHAYSLVVAARPRLVIDLISLLTIHELGVSEVVVRLFGKLLIAQTTVEALQNFIRDKKAFQGYGLMTIGKEGERFVRTEITPEEVKRVVDHFDNMVSWVSENCEVVPVTGALDIPREQRNLLEDMLGAPFLDSVLIAKEEGNLLFSDDERLRSFARPEFKVEGVWTQIILMFALSQNILGKEKYNQAILQLVCMHYYHTGIDAYVLIEAARKSEWLPKYPYTEALRLLHGDRSDKTTTLIVATLFLYELWKQPILPLRRDYLVYSLLDALAVGRNPQRTADTLSQMVKVKFYLLYLEAARIISLIESWRRMHLA